MHIEVVDYRVAQSHQRPSQDDDGHRTLLTPALRAALEALEREFQEFLQVQPH